MTTPANDWQPRYTPGRFRDCPWCGGLGCAACASEADKAYKRALPNTPEGLAEAMKLALGSGQ